MKKNTNKKKNKEEQLTKYLLLIISIIIFLVIIISGIVLYNNGSKRVQSNNSNDDIIVREGSTLYRYYSKYQESNIEAYTKGYNYKDNFSLIIEDTYSINNDLYITGVIKSGNVKIGNILEVSGMDKEEVKVEIKKIIVSGASVSSATIGDRVELVVDSKYDIVKGQTISTIDSLLTTNNINARIYLFKEDESNSTTITKDIDSNINISLWNNIINGKITSIDNMIRSGEYTNVSILLNNSITIDIGYSFKIIEDSTVVGIGVITEVNN